MSRWLGTASPWELGEMSPAWYAAILAEFRRAHPETKEKNAQATGATEASIRLAAMRFAGEPVDIDFM